MICPRCKGSKTITASHVAYADGSHGYEVPLSCDQCGGAGEVSDEMTEWIRAGEAMRQDRLARQMTLREEAKRRGLTPVELSRMEFGKVKPVA